MRIKKCSNEVFFDTQGLTPIATVTSLANRDIPILNVNGQPVPAAMRPIRGQGGFLQLGLPLSRLFGANPTNRATAGWSIYLGYGVDTAYARDAVRFDGNGLRKTDLGTATVHFKLNKYVTFVEEVSYWDTRAATLKIFRGLPAKSCVSCPAKFIRRPNLTEPGNEPLRNDRAEKLFLH